MENSVILDKFAGWLGKLGLSYISEFEAGLILAAVFLLLLMILWLVFRKARLWYWKTDIQIDTFKKIDGRLQIVEEKLTCGVLAAAEKAESDPLSGEEKGQPSENIEPEAAEDCEGLTYVGRSGRVYTEAELELQIRE
jgi:hypothetical protein